MSTTETQVQTTPGPWTVWEPDEDSLEGQYEIVSEYFADGSKRFCPQMVAKCFAESQEADARLIAAAPELLAACRGVLEASGMAGESQPWKIALRAAVAKVEGRPAPTPMADRSVEHRDNAWWIVEHRPGTEVHLTDLAPNQRVAWGDGETYYLLLTRTDARTEIEALCLAATPAPQGAPTDTEE